MLCVGLLLRGMEKPFPHNIFQRTSFCHVIPVGTATTLESEAMQSNEGERRKLHPCDGCVAGQDYTGARKLSYTHQPILAGSTKSKQSGKRVPLLGKGFCSA